MPHDYIPRRDLEFLRWSINFNERIGATPEAYGLTPAQAAEYAALHETFAMALARSQEPSTRTSPSIVAKNEARAVLERRARALAAIVRSRPEVTDAQRVGLGLSARAPGRPRIARPEASPWVTVAAVRGRRVRLRLRDRESARRGRPRGVAGAMVVYHVGERPPAEASRWTFGRLTSRTDAEVVLPVAVKPGARVWLTASWFNPRGQSGPTSPPVLTHAGFACEVGERRLRRAA